MIGEENYPTMPLSMRGGEGNLPRQTTYVALAKGEGEGRVGMEL